MMGRPPAAVGVAALDSVTIPLVNITVPTTLPENIMTINYILDNPEAVVGIGIAISAGDRVQGVGRQPMHMPSSAGQQAHTRSTRG